MGSSGKVPLKPDSHHLGSITMKQESTTIAYPPSTSALVSLGSSPASTVAMTRTSVRIPCGRRPQPDRTRVCAGHRPATRFSDDGRQGRDQPKPLSHNSFRAHSAQTAGDSRLRPDTPASNWRSRRCAMTEPPTRARRRGSPAGSSSGEHPAATAGRPWVTGAPTRV